ncbi:putative transposon Ty3-I Gag-Pol polyprotein [Apostichopus japonicus]|uniref:Putative transposon Ty3-I Gag-Pol polyprotein n=1 Tax=Stichopus japonicus TaxID=307972 RepID=A0A2G8JXG0_STIJA|nr:putative transposon Ty3-I Gag-Pol polyprotein [Apostichopus japonicus]
MSQSPRAFQARPGNLDFSAVEGATVEKSSREGVTYKNQGTQTTVEALVERVDGTEGRDGELDLLSPSPSGMLEIAGKEIGCILDTGAEASLIPADIFHSKLECVTGPMRRLSMKVRVVGFSGAEVPVEGYVRAPLTYHETSAEVGFLIVSPELAMTDRRAEIPVLLGCNALKALASNAGKESDFSIVLGRRKVKVETDESEVRQSEVSLVTVAELVSGNMANSVNCQLAPGDDFGSKPWLVGMEGRIPGLHVLEGCIFPESSEVRILVINESGKDIKLRAATATELELEEEISVREENDCLQVEILNFAVDQREEFQQEQQLDNAGESGHSLLQTEEPQSSSVEMEDGSVIILPIGVALPSLGTHEKRQVALLLDKNKEVFSKGEFDLGFCDDIPHAIKTTDSAPIRQPYRRIPLAQMSDVKQLLQDMMEQKIIRRSIIRMPVQWF